MSNQKPNKAPSPPAVPGKQSVSADMSPAAKPVEAAELGRTLELPRGAMLVMRASGGIRFTTQEMAVYPDGRVTLGAGDVSRKAHERAVRTLNDAQVVRLRRLIEQSGFFRMKQPEGTQSPDGYAYEIVARIGSKNNRLEVFTGTMPEAIQPLVDFLMRWMPEEKSDSGTED